MLRTKRESRDQDKRWIKECTKTKAQTEAIVKGKRRFSEGEIKQRKEMETEKYKAKCDKRKRQLEEDRKI